MEAQRKFGISRSRLIFFIITSVVPFLIYSGYYYYKMIYKAAFSFKDFEYFEVSYTNKETGFSYSFSSRSYKLIMLAHAQVVVERCIQLSTEDLHAFHRVLIDNIFFDMPSTLNRKANYTAYYSINVRYKRRVKLVEAFLPIHPTIYSRKLDNIQKYIERKFIIKM